MLMICRDRDTEFQIWVSLIVFIPLDSQLQLNCNILLRNRSLVDSFCVVSKLH